MFELSWMVLSKIMNIFGNFYCFTHCIIWLQQLLFYRIIKIEYISVEKNELLNLLSGKDYWLNPCFIIIFSEVNNTCIKSQTRKFIISSPNQWNELLNFQEWYWIILWELLNSGFLLLRFHWYPSITTVYSCI